MEIVLATNGLIGIGGSETYLLTVAEHLQRLGHEVTVHATEGGAMSEFMSSRGLTVAIGEGELPERCDALLVQDSAMAYALADRWPETPPQRAAGGRLADPARAGDPRRVGRRRSAQAHGPRAARGRHGGREPAHAQRHR